MSLQKVWCRSWAHKTGEIQNPKYPENDQKKLTGCPCMNTSSWFSPYTIRKGKAREEPEVDPLKHRVQDKDLSCWGLDALMNLGELLCLLETFILMFFFWGGYRIVTPQSHVEVLTPPVVRFLTLFEIEQLQIQLVKIR